MPVGGVYITQQEAVRRFRRLLDRAKRRDPPIFIGGITDEMVERAARAWEGDDTFDSYDEGFKAEAMADARRALMAALKQEQA